MFGGVFDSASIESKIKEKEALTEAPDFWDDHSKAEKVMASIRKLRNRIEPWKTLLQEYDDLIAMFELAEESGESEYEDEIKTMLNELQQKFEHLNILNLLSGEVDGNSAFISIHSGAGGTEAEDWAAMLSRMYSRWAERHGYKIEIVDQLEAEGGIKSITMQIEGDYVYGHLKGEAGIHRLVRISPFDSNARRHTSFSSVYVFPVLDDSIEVDIRSEDLRIDTYRASGAGGQHINKTDSAVRITHLPTGIVVCSQSQRSQIQNREKAMQVLKSRLYQKEHELQEQKKRQAAGEQMENGWGSQIRSYILHPYALVKDHRTSLESSQPQAVLDGDINEFLISYLQWLKNGDNNG